MNSKKVSNIGGSITEVSLPILPGWPPVLKNFWRFTKDVALKFNKQLKKDRTKKILKAVAEDFTNKR